METKYSIVKAYKIDKNGFDVQDGYDLFVNGEWGNRYCLKRDAKAAVEQAKAEETKGK